MPTCTPSTKESQSTIKMEKGYYMVNVQNSTIEQWVVAIHNKNGKGLLRVALKQASVLCEGSQSTIKMEKGYYLTR